jgi:ubiquinone/menaquinone biosynthesis C-methylase UbiE
MSQLVFDDDAARRIEAMYGIGDAVRRRRLVREALGAASGERVLDVGCGPGFYCAELAEEVGPAGSVVGLDGSPAMLELAARRCAGRDNVELHEADVLSLPVDDASVDAALCVQVLEYVPDATAGLAEMHRALRPGGRVVVWDIDWATVSLGSEDPARTARVLRAWDEHLAHPSLPRTLAARLRSAGFEDVGMDGHAFATGAFDPETYGAALVPFVGAFVVGRDGITDAEARAWVAEQRRLGERGEFYFTTSQFCFTAMKPGRPAA